MGKIYHNLYSQIGEFENLRLSFKQAAAGKRSKPTVAAFEYDLEGQLIALQEELRTESFLARYGLSVVQICVKV